MALWGNTGRRALVESLSGGAGFDTVSTTMSILRKVGLLLVGIGVMTLILGFVELRSKNEIIRIGEFRASASTREKHPELGYVGAGVAVVGGLLLVAGSRK